MPGFSLNEDETGRLRITSQLKERGYNPPDNTKRRNRGARTGREVGDIQKPLVIEIEELERVVIKLEGEGGTKFIGWGSDETRPLPIGSTLDQDNGIFYWSPGPGFLGQHILNFAVTDGVSRSIPVRVLVNIVPKNFPKKKEKT
jgi:hypothetical protein